MDPKLGWCGWYVSFFLGNMFFLILLKKILVHVETNGQRNDYHRFKDKKHNSKKISTWNPRYHSTYARGGNRIDYKLK